MKWKRINNYFCFVYVRSFFLYNCTIPLCFLILIMSFIKQHVWWPFGNLNALATQRCSCCCSFWPLVTKNKYAVLVCLQNGHEEIWMCPVCWHPLSRVAQSYQRKTYIHVYVLRWQLSRQGKPYLDSVDRQNVHKYNSRPSFRISTIIELRTTNHYLAHA